MRDSNPGVQQFADEHCRRLAAGARVKPCADRFGAARMVSAGMKLIACLLVWAAAPGAALGQDAYPVKFIRWVLPYSAGSTVDLQSRQVGARLAERLGQPVVMENRAGAGGAIGFEFVSRAAPDGYTLTSANNSFLILSAIRPTPYDPLRDFTPVMQMTHSYSLIAVHPSIPANTVTELIAYSKANPGKLNYASPGIGTYGHLVNEWFKLTTGADLTHIPHKSVGAGVLGLVTGDVGVLITSIELVVSHVKAGKIKLLAAAGQRRTPFLPELPSSGEQGIKAFDPQQWVGMLVPAGTRGEIVARLAADISRILADPAFREDMFRRNIEPAPASGEQFGARMKVEFPMWRSLIKAGNIRPE